MKTIKFLALALTLSAALTACYESRSGMSGSDTTGADSGAVAPASVPDTTNATKAPDSNTVAPAAKDTVSKPVTPAPITPAPTTPPPTTTPAPGTPTTPKG